MRTIKSLFTALAAGSLAVIMASSAFAATAEYANQAVTVKDYTAPEGATQTTVLIVEKNLWTNIGLPNTTTEDPNDKYELTAENVMYINQFYTSTALTNMGVKDALANPSNYVVLLGSDAGDVVAVDFASVLNKGDVTGDGHCTTADLSAVVLHVGEKVFITNPQFIANGDVVGNDGEITAADMAKIVLYVGEKIDSFE